MTNPANNILTDTQIKECLTATIVAEVKTRLEADGKTGAHFDFFSHQVRSLASRHIAGALTNEEIAKACDGFGWEWEAGSGHSLDITSNADLDEATIHFT